MKNITTIVLLLLTVIGLYYVLVVVTKLDYKRAEALKDCYQTTDLQVFCPDEVIK